MLRNLFAAASFLTLLSTGLAADEIVKDNFEGQSEGQQLSDLTNWKFYAGWIKPEYGKVVVEKGNKFVRMHGDIFARNPSSLEDKLTYRFKIRAAGTDGELGGFSLRAVDGKARYDVLFLYKNGVALLAKDTSGTREELDRTEGVKNDTFQDVIVTVERVNDGVKFTVSIDGAKTMEKVETHELPFLRETFTAGFFTYQDKVIDIDDVEFTRGK